jgi:hypothetical protein
MKKEYEERLEVARKKLAEYHAASQKDEEILLEVTRSLESLVLTEDTEVLCELFDFFISETADEYDMCEALEGLILDHFYGEQILQAYYQKFDSLAEKNPERCAFIAGTNFFDQNENDVKFEKFRKMFNAIKSPHSGKFLKKLKSLLFAGSCVGKFGEMNKVCVHALEEDMKSW